MSQASYTGHRLELDVDCSRCGNRATTIVKIKVNDDEWEIPCCHEHAQEVAWAELDRIQAEQLASEVIYS